MDAAQPLARSRTRVPRARARELVRARFRDFVERAEGGAGRPGEDALAHLAAIAQERALGHLPDDAPRQRALGLVTNCAQAAEALVLGQRLGLGEQAGLADPGRPLDHDQTPLAAGRGGERLRDARGFGVAFDGPARHGAKLLDAAGGVVRGEAAG